MTNYLLIASFIPLCWFWMMGLHELGHMMAAWVTGGTVTQVVLHPLAISRTDVSPNTMPLTVVWGGPVLGVMIPVCFYFITQACKVSWNYLPRFFAGFCLIANGAYIGIGSFAKVGDTREMLQYGSPVWSLWAFGVLTIPFGFLLWNNQAKFFGIGKEQQEVKPKYVYVVFGLLMATITLMLLMSDTV